MTGPRSGACCLMTQTQSCQSVISPRLTVGNLRSTLGFDSLSEPMRVCPTITQEETVKHRMMSCFAVIALMLALSAPSPARGPHPQIEAALAALHNAKEHLEHAAHDFGGHRVDAIRAIDEADRQLRICLEY